MFKLFNILPRKIKLKFLLASIMVFVTVIIGLFLPNFVSQFIKLIFTDKQYHDIEIVKGFVLFKNAQRDYIKNALIIIISVQTIITSILTFVYTWIFVWAAESASYFYRLKLYEKVNALSLKNIADLKPESIMTKISNDVAVFWEFLVSGLRVVIKGLIMIIGGAVIAFMVNVYMALVVVPVIPTLLLLVGVLSKFVSPIIAKTQVQVEEVTKDIDENIKGSLTIKTFNLENIRNEQFKQTNSLWYKFNLKFNTIISLFQPLFFLINNFIVIGIYMFTRQQVISKVATDQTVVEMNIFIEYLWLIAFGILLVTGFLQFFIRAKVSAKRIWEVFQIQPDKLFVQDGLNLIDKDKNIDEQSFDLSIKNLNFKYYKDNPNYSLTNINLDVPYGSTLGIIGLFASGKSTLVSLLLNNYVYEEGSIKIANKEIKEVNTEDLLKVVGIVYQDPMLFGGTIRSNMLWSKPDATDEEINFALQNACAYDFVYKLSDNIDHPIVQGATNLSGGQKQRLSIARTLLRKPKILILDDSTSALDNITTRKVIENIKKNYQCTTILISQKIGALKNSDQIAVMEAGKITAVGKHNDLVQNCEFYAQIHNSQLEL
ncbi:ABC transporter ATP-binding protein [Mycoplasma simbae]|uniref:ABC transporter ATP-binding protein n=1 Tax=Mycoplasma simbae TaxID=36744 RepID=UPI0004951269|nr:ABC transporter ATP-binding protein [Mycoplasma simbae]